MSGSAKLAKLVNRGASQSVCLPPEFHFEGSEVYVRRDARTGNVILSSRPEPAWLEFIAMRHELGALPGDFLMERPQSTEPRDPFDFWAE